MKLLKKNIFILLILINSSILLSNKSLFAKCFFQSCLNSKKELDKSLAIKFTNADSSNSKLENILIKEDIKLREIFEIIFISDEAISELNKEKAGYEIESDTQYSKNDVFYAEGNVKILLLNGIFESDKVSYDRKNKIFKVHSKFTFKSGDQFLDGDSLEYDFSKSEGFVKNVYGQINLKTISEDLSFNKNLFEDEICPSKEKNSIDLPSEVELTDKNLLALDRQFNLQPSFNLDSDVINKWRFKSQKIILNQNSWNSDLIYFTNDPFNKPQLLLKSREFSGEINNGKVNLFSNSSRVILDDKFAIPLGKRTIQDNQSNPSWGFGYDENDKDGFFISREFEPINLSKNFKLNLKSYLLLQRAIKGESDVFREENSSLFSENVSVDNLDISDYLGLDADISGKLSDWYLKINSNLKSLNPNRLYDSFSSELQLSKNIFNITNFDQNIDDEDCYERNSDNPRNNYSLDLGLYGIYDKDDLYSAYGGKIYSSFSEEKDNKEKIYSLIFDLGEFQGKSNGNNSLLNLARYGYIASVSHNYKLVDFGSKKQNYDKTNKFSSSIVNQGFFLDTNISSGLYAYSNDTSQSIYSFEVGPRVVYGNLRRSFFDFTDIEIKPQFILKNGNSPFSFDDFNNDSRIKLGLNQQIFGPIIMGFSTDLNINNNSSSYGNLENKKYSIGISRRAYSINLSYLEEDKTVYFGFEIFDFGFTKNSTRF